MPGSGPSRDPPSQTHLAFIRFGHRITDDLAGRAPGALPAGRDPARRLSPGPDAGTFRLTGPLLVAFGNPSNLPAPLGDRGPGAKRPE